MGHGRRSALFIDVASCLADWNADMNRYPEEIIKRTANVSTVSAGRGYHPSTDVLCTVENTGNGYIAHFPSHSDMRQDHYVCLDYDQAHDLILGLSAFKKELGFA